MNGNYPPTNPSLNLNERLDIDFALQAAGLGVWELDSATNQVLWDDRCRELFGLVKDNLLPYEQAIQYIHPEDRKRVDQAVKRALNPRSDGGYDVTYRTLGADDGKLRWVRFHGRSYFTESGQVYRFAGVAQEVTQQVMAHRQVEESEKRFQSLATQVPLAVFIADEQANVEYWNPWWLNFTGQLLDQALGRNWEALIHSHDLDALLSGYLDATRKRGTYSIEARVRRKDGAYRYMLFTGGPRYTADGTYMGTIGTGLDIDARKQAEQALAESEARFRTMAEEADILIAMSDETGQTTFLNQAWTDLTGQSVSSLLQMGWVDLVHPDDRGPVLDLYRTALQRQESFTREFRIQNKDGSYSWLLSKCPARFHSDGTFKGYISSSVDITEIKQAEEALRTSEQRFQAAVAAVQGVLWTNSADGKMEGEQASWSALTGQSYEEYQDYGWADAVHPDDSQRTIKAWEEAVRERRTFTFEHRMRVKAGHWEVFSIRAIPLLNPDGSIREWVGVHTNVTEQRRAEKALRLSEAKLRSVVETAPVAIGLFMGRDLVIELPNQTFIDIVGKGPDIVGKPLREVMPELITENQPFLRILDEVFSTGRQFSNQGALVQIVRHGVMTHNYYNITYTPLCNETGEVYAILDIAVDVTEQIKAQQELEQQKTYLQNALAIANLGTYHIDIATRTGTYEDTIRQWFGLDSPTESMDVILSKVHSDDQALVARTLNSSQQSEELSHHDITYRLADTSGKTTRYLRSIGKTLFNEGKPYAIYGILQDVTPQIQARQTIEEREAILRGAIELAELGTWELDVPTGKITFSDRIKSWFGFDGSAKTLKTVYNPIHEKDRSRVEAAIGRALALGSDGLYDEEYTLVDQLTGQERIVHAQGITLFDEQKNPVKITGTAQDITPQRKLQLALQQQVQQRTKELEAANEKLAATNEEYATLNKELEEANGHLLRSNENLQQFAYVASHDLQEPLRKIQQFGDLLQSRYGMALGDGAVYIERMQTSAGRMSTLIEDLLDYSRISTRREMGSAVSLDNVLVRVLSTLELRIQETEAQISVEPLPTILGDTSQLSQLFQNLLSNALKFRRRDESGGSSGALIAPQIMVRSELVTAADLPERVKPAHAAATYYRIDIVDNGVGFEEKYVDRIFQVFQRLHGKSQYAGTGIGLAICEKVAANHGGAITASSRPGQGSVFSVYFPVS